MEIQDRNNIMQLALNLNFDAKNVSSLPELNFMDMVKNNDTVFSSDNSLSANSLSLKKTDPKVKSDLNKKELPTADKGKNASSDKIKNKPDQDKKVKASGNKTDVADNTIAQDNTTEIKENNSEEAPATYINNDSNTEENITPAINDTQTVVNENINSTAAPVQIALNQLNDLPEILLPTAQLVDTNPKIQTLETDIQTVTLEENQSVVPNNEAIVDIFSSEPEQNIHISKNTTEQTIQPQQSEILSSDDLLIRQVQDFDRKLGTEHQVKIDVNVNEAKIAEPVEKNVLQNSFTLTAMLQSTDNNETIIDTPISEQNVATLQSSQDDIQVQPVPVANNSVAFVADTSNTQADLTENNSSIINVTRGIDTVTDTAPKAINQRLQEINNDNSLRANAKEVVEQIKVNITKSAVKGVDTIDIQLKPEDLGKVQVRMYISKDGRLHADVITSRAETAELLQREVSSLSKSFQDAGYNTDEQSFNFSSQNENQTHRQNEDNQFHQFIGESLEQENEPAQANDNLIYDPKVGLNIRV